MKYSHRKAVFQTLLMRWGLVVCLFVLGCRDKGVGDPNEHVEAEKGTPPSVAKVDRPIQEHRNLWDHLKYDSVSAKQISGVAWANDSLWVLDSGSRQIVCTNKRTGGFKHIGLPRESKPIGLAFDGRAFWTWDKVKKVFCSMTMDGKSDSIKWPGKVSQALGHLDGKLIFVSDDDTKIQCLDIRTEKVVNTFDAPCQYIKDLVWDGRYLWCLLAEKLIGYDIKRQMAFTYIPLKGKWWWATFGDSRFHLAQRRASIPGDWKTLSFPMARNGDVCFGPPQEFVRVVAGGVVDEEDTQTLKTVTVIFKKVPLDDVHIEVKEINFNLPCKVIPYKNAFRWLVFPDITISPGDFRSIHGTIRYSLQERQHIVIPDEIPVNQAIPASIGEFLGLTNDMKDPSVVAADRQTGAYKEVNPYWKMRRIHDWILDYMKVARVLGKKTPSEILQLRYGVCDEYKILMTTFCRRNGIPCQNLGAAHPHAPHAWNFVYLSGNVGWIDVDVQADDIMSQDSGSFNYNMIRAIGLKKEAVSCRIHGLGLPAKISIEGTQIPLDFRNCAFTEDGSMLHNKLVKFDFENCHITDDSVGTPACPLIPKKWLNNDGMLELFWPQGYDLEDGIGLSYEIYASPKPMKGQRNRENLVAKVETNRWLIQGLERSSGGYYFMVVAVDRNGKKPDLRKKGQLYVGRGDLVKYVWRKNS